MEHTGKLLAPYHCECRRPDTQWNHLVFGLPEKEDQEVTEGARGVWFMKVSCRNENSRLKTSSLRDFPT